MIMNHDHTDEIKKSSSNKNKPDPKNQKLQQRKHQNKKS